MPKDKDEVEISEDDVAELDEVLKEKDPFEGHDVVPGLEHLGRVIKNSQGHLSGSPANYEALRGKSSEQIVTEGEAVEEVERILAMYPAPEEEDEE